jgi:hypothetical protein
MFQKKLFPRKTKHLVEHLRMLYSSNEIFKIKMGLSYLVCNQIWQNYSVNDGHFGYSTKSLKGNPGPWGSKKHDDARRIWLWWVFSVCRGWHYVFAFHPTSAITFYTAHSLIMKNTDSHGYLCL